MSDRHQHGQQSGTLTAAPDLAVIIPIHNAAPFLRPCLHSVLQQVGLSLRCVELVLFDDASTDASLQVATDMLPTLRATLYSVTLLSSHDGPFGVGGARNRACKASSAPILVFQDADDVMHPTRLRRSLRALTSSRCPSSSSPTNNNNLVPDMVGGAFARIPPGETPRYEAYHRRIRTSDLPAHMFRDAPLAMPTVACRRTVWHTVPFRPGPVPEDLHFQYAALAAGFSLARVEDRAVAEADEDDGAPLTFYRFHPGMTSLTLSRRALLAVRAAAFETLVLGAAAAPWRRTSTAEAGAEMEAEAEAEVEAGSIPDSDASRRAHRPLPRWADGFAIWGCGRDGKEFFKALSEQARKSVTCWGDIDPRKIGTTLRDRPVVHFTQLHPPITCCVALDREGREFEANLASLSLRPGIDYVHIT